MDAVTRLSDIKLPPFIRHHGFDYEPLDRARQVYGKNVALLTLPVLNRWKASGISMPFKFIGLFGQGVYSPFTAQERKAELHELQFVGTKKKIILDERGSDTFAYANPITRMMVTGHGETPLFYFKKPMEQKEKKEKKEKPAEKPAKKPQKPFKTLDLTTNETRAELKAFLVKRNWSESEVNTMSMSQLRAVSFVERTCGLRNVGTNETAAELRAFLKSRNYTMAMLKGNNVTQLRRLAEVSRRD